MRDEKENEHVQTRPGKIKEKNLKTRKKAGIPTQEMEGGLLGLTSCPLGPH